ncbi:MAG: diacylglycerol kinase [Clostridia bacterium]|nr:diacylglycerol kinase [Clostridia bacterium]
MRSKENKENPVKKNKTFGAAIGHAIDGVIRAFKTERNLRIDYIIGLFVLITSLFFDFTKTEFACICLTIGFVIFAEMINSTVEYIVDLITDQYDDRAKAAKDIAAGGVLIASCVSVVVAYFLFVDKISNATTAIISSILNSKLHILFTIVFGVVILTIILKGIFGKDEDYAHSGPSLRIALAFALTTYLYIITNSFVVCGIAFLLTIFITQARAKDKKNKLLYVILSAGIGILLVLIIYQIVLMKPSIENILFNLLGGK